MIIACLYMYIHAERRKNLLRPRSLGKKETDKLKNNHTSSLLMLWMNVKVS